VNAGTAVDKLDNGNPRLGDGRHTRTMGNRPANRGRQGWFVDRSTSEHLFSQLKIGYDQTKTSAADPDPHMLVVNSKIFV
jgi:hypothetical protein